MSAKQLKAFPNAIRKHPKLCDDCIDNTKCSGLTLYNGASPAFGVGIVCNRTLIVSNGCPTNTKQAPPTPPAMKFLNRPGGVGSTEFVTSTMASASLKNYELTNEYDFYSPVHTSLLSMMSAIVVKTVVRRFIWLATSSLTIDDQCDATTDQ